MFQNLLKTALRNIVKHKTYSFINVVGLAVGLTCAIIILLWIQDELSIDNYHEKRDRICQAYLKGTQEDHINFQPTTSPAIAPILKSEYPEVEETVRMGRLGEMVFKIGEKRILESGGGATEPSFFTIFTYPLILGDPATALLEPHSIVLTESMAQKYFGEQNPIGQTIRLNNQFDFQVTGVIEDVPENTHYSFDFVVPFVFLRELGYDIDGRPFFPCSYLTYVLLKPGISYTGLNEKISKRIFSKGEIIKFEICLIPFNETYLFETDGWQKIRVLGSVALMIILIACINFTNLATARSTIRAKEIGLRKVAGANRVQIARQFLGESMLLAVIATVMGLILAELILNSFNQLSGKSLSINFTNIEFVFGVIGLTVFTGLAAGIYPAIYLSKFQPAKVIRLQSRTAKRAILRKVLIVTQFVFCIAFIISTIVMSRQMHFIRNFNLGVNENNIVYVRLDGDISQKYETVKQELLKHSSIASVTTASTIPTAIRSGSFFYWGKEDEVARRICETRVGYDYAATLELEMAEGRFFSKTFPNDVRESIIVNETAVREAGLEAPLGKPFLYGDRYLTLIGIVKDFQHDKRLRREPDPLSFFLRPEGETYMFVKINAEKHNIHEVQKAVFFIQSVCDKFSPERPLNYNYLSEFSFETDRTLALVKRIILYATVMAILVSCLGLFGLSAFFNEQKTKEIGIRKALGASVPGLIAMSAKEFSKWVLIANILAWPVAWFGMNMWLQDFAYRITLNVWFFLLAGVAALGLALFTVAWHSIRAANANPIDSLRYE